MPHREKLLLTQLGLRCPASRRRLLCYSVVLDVEVIVGSRDPPAFFSRSPYSKFQKVSKRKSAIGMHFERQWYAVCFCVLPTRTDNFLSHSLQSQRQPIITTLAFVPDSRVECITSQAGLACSSTVKPRSNDCNGKSCDSTKS